MTNTKTAQEGLEEDFLRKQISEIVFYGDVIQLRFEEGSSISLYAEPTIIAQHGLFTTTDGLFFSELIGLTKSPPKRVSAITHQNGVYAFTFSNGVSIRLPEQRVPAGGTFMTVLAGGGGGDY